MLLPQAVPHTSCAPSDLQVVLQMAFVREGALRVDGTCTWRGLHLVLQSCGLQVGSSEAVALLTSFGTDLKGKLPVEVMGRALFTSPNR